MASLNLDRELKSVIIGDERNCYEGLEEVGYEDEYLDVCDILRGEENSSENQVSMSSIS